MTQTAYDNNDAAPIKLGTRGHILVGAEQLAQVSGASTTPCVFAERQGGAARALATVAYLNNGTSLDQKRKPSAASRLPSSAASTHVTVAKAFSVDLMRVIGRNASASVLYLKLYNKASAPNVGVDAPAISIPLPRASTFSFDLDAHYFPAGLVYALTQGSGDTDATPLARAIFLASTSPSLDNCATASRLR